MFRFRLRTLLVFLTLCAFGAGFLALRLRLEKLRVQAVITIKEKGGNTVEDKTKQVVRVHLSGEKFDDAVLSELTQHMKYLPNLNELDLVRVKVTDNGAEVLAELDQVKEVYIFETLITEDGIRNLRKLMPEVSIKAEEPDPIASKMVATTVYSHAITALTGSPDQSNVATGSGDGSIRIWNFDNPKPLAIWKAHNDWVFDIDYSPDGQSIASGGGDNLVKVWNSETKELVCEFTESEDDVHDVGFTPDGNYLIAASDDMKIRLWDMRTRKLLRVLKGHTRQIPRLSIKPDGTMLASASRDNTVRLWELPSGDPIGVLTGHQHDVMTVAFDSTGKLLASGDENGTIKLWRVKTQMPVKTIVTQLGSIYDIAFDSDLSALASCGIEGIQLWDLLTGGTHASLDQDYVSRISFEANEKFLVSTNIAGELRLLDRATADTAKVFRTMYGQRGLVNVR